MKGRINPKIQEQNEEELHVDWCNWMYAEISWNADKKQIYISGGDRRKTTKHGFNSLKMIGCLLGGSKYADVSN